MKILIATGLYPPEIGGPATHSKLLEEEFPKYDIHVSVLPFKVVRKLPKIIRHIVYFIHTLAKGRNVDIIYALDPVSVGLPALLAAKFLRKRFIVRIAGDYAWEQGTVRYGISESLDTFSKKYTEYPFFVRTLKRIQNLVASKSEKVIVPSNYLKKIVSQWGIPKKKIKVIYNSFDPPENFADKKVLRELLQFKGKLVISVGRLIPWKGFETLVTLMPKLVKQFPDLKLLIVGSGPDESKLESIIGKKKMHDHVILVGALDHNTLLRYLKAADVFVLNTFYEGFSHQLLEVMALGTPIVTTNVGGNPEIIEHEKNGIMVSYNDTNALSYGVAKLLNDKAYAQKLSKQAKLRVKQFPQKNMLSKLIQEFTQTP